MIRKWAAYVAWTLLLLAGSLAWADPQGILPQGPGRDLVEQNCTACHSQAIILQNRMTRNQWDETITWMQDKQGLWELEPAVRRGILDYLAMHLAPATGATPSADVPVRRKMYPYEYKANPL